MASISVNIGTAGAVFHALGLEWVFYHQGAVIGYKTSYDAGVTFGLQQVIPLNAYAYATSLFYDRVNNRIHIAAAYGSGGSNNPVNYISGVPAEDGSITWGAGQELWRGTNPIGSDKTNPQIICDSNGFPWIMFRELTLFGSTFDHIAKSSTKDGTFTEQWHKASSLYYPGNAGSPYYREGILIPNQSGGMWMAYISHRYDAWYHEIDSDPPVLFYRIIDAAGNFSDPPTRIAGAVNSNPTGAVCIGTDMHIVWPDSTTGSILHAVNTTVKVVQAGITDTPRLMHDIQRNRLLCFWTSGNHIYYKAYDLTTGRWDAEPTDWLNETAYGGIGSALVLDPLNDFEYERFPMAYNSQAYVRFALSDLQPPVVQTLPATEIKLK